ncbi:hypothetical protein SEA_CRACKLEWINK_114 [Mycobacterium phage Cracklewink]|uniref:Uncharacterized protein n=1 Tax=Mycobacterium phage Bipper TaxID=1805457 RepID=A0A142F2P2_9CAUD|nr:hypothetical protein KCH39_gp063 [Mycobacterium phage Bipper]AMQ67049.1 hypothetical protein SEA_BIPPER_114 [Mycobacterium phage Bipper]QDF19400.1 hypothetical protein SEA_CRACKLEWINK_114 [Mycobacterium phage Cracklewink]
MSTTDPYTHDRQACSDCDRQRRLWGPDSHCDRTHDFREGQLVTIGRGTRPWTITWATGSLVQVSREIPARYFGTRLHSRTFGKGGRRPITDLHLVEPQRVPLADRKRSIDGQLVCPTCGGIGHTSCVCKGPRMA